MKKNIEVLNEIKSQKNDSKIIKQYTIINMKVDWDCTGVTEEEYNEHYYSLGVGYGWIYNNGTLYHNSSLLGKDDELVQVVFENNNENLTLEDIENHFEPPTPYSGFLYQCWGGLVIDGFEIKPLEEDEVKMIYNNLITLNDLK